MSRSLHASTATELQTDAIVAFIMVKMELGNDSNGNSQDLFLNSTSQNFTYSSDVYTGLGGLGTISAVEEGTDFANRPMSLELSGVDVALVSTALNINYQNKPVTIMLGVLDDEDAFIGTPTIIFKGKIDTMSVEIAENSKISVRCTSDLADWERPSDGRYTNEDQVSRFAGDVGLEFTSQAAEKEIFFGRPTP